MGTVNSAMFLKASSYENRKETASAGSHMKKSLTHNNTGVLRTNILEFCGFVQQRVVLT